MPDDTPAALTLGNPDHCRGGHPTIRSIDGDFRPPAAFDFGRGRTELDQFVRHVTVGNPPKYAEQWTRTDWTIAFECSLHLEDGQGKLCPCAPVPDWLPDVVNEHISFSYDLPYPAIGLAEDPAIDWFALHDAHPERWNLDIPWDGAPTLDRARAGLAIARALGGTRELCADLAPHGDAVLVTFSGMTVTWPAETGLGAHEAAIASHFAGTDTYLNPGYAEHLPQPARTWLWC